MTEKKIIKIVIIDDEPLAIELLVDYLSRLNDIELIGQFFDAREGLAFLQSQQADLVLLDINMPDLNGIELAKLINDQTRLIFTTAHTEYAFQGFELDAVDYLHKPISFDRFSRAINKFRLLLASRQKNKTISIRCDGETRVINLADILYVEAARKYVVYHCQSGEKTSENLIHLGSMKATESKLSQLGFIRIHKSFIVNPMHIKRFSRFEVEIGERSLPLGETYKKAFFSQIEA